MKGFCVDWDEQMAKRGWVTTSFGGDAGWLVITLLKKASVEAGIGTNLEVGLSILFNIDSVRVRMMTLKLSGY